MFSYIERQVHIDLDADPFLPYDWKVEEHKKGGQIHWAPEKVSLYTSPKQKGDKHIEGNKLREELSKKLVYNANMLDFLLKKENQYLIPDDWKGKYVIFWTVYRNSGGYQYVRFLYWDGREWDWGSRWLGYDWFSSYPSAVSSS